MMAVGIRELLAEAEAEVCLLSVEEVAALRTDPGTGSDTVLVDVRDVREIEREGMIEGARHAPRGMLEFWIDPASPYHKAWLGEPKTYVFYCASGWRSLLAAQVAGRMGLTAASLRGGFTDWSRAGQPVVARAAKAPTPAGKAD